MSKVGWKNLSPNLGDHRQTSSFERCSSAPTSTHARRRKNINRFSLHAMKNNESETNSSYLIPQDCVTWQTISQQLTLQLEQSHRLYSSNQGRRDHVIPFIDNEQDLKAPSTTVEGKSCDQETAVKTRASHKDDMIEVDTNTSLLKMDAHLIPLSKLVERFNSNLTTGLTDDIVTQHRSRFGQNKLTPARPPSLLQMYMKQLVLGFNGLLWIATLFAFLSYKPFGEPNPDICNLGLGVLLIAVIVSSATFNFYQEIKSMKIVASFSKMQSTIATVRRNGMEIQTNAEELVPGDIVRIRLGEKVPADCRLISCDDLQVNTSNLTGESAPVICTIKSTDKNFMESTNMIFYSSLVMQGAGEAIVINIGDETVLGHVGKMTRNTSSSEITGLHREINRFVLFVISAAIISTVLLWLTWGFWLNIAQKGYITVNGNIINSIGMIVCFIPEGLPAAVTLVLTIVAKRMYKQKVMVKSLSTVETFNCVSVIATDKTGTLTMNQMTVTSLVWGNQGKYTVPICTNEQKRSSSTISNSSSAMKDLILGACLCNNATKQSSSEMNQIVGDAADVALYNLCHDACSVDIEQVKKVNPRINIIPFNSKNKFMITANVLERMSTSLTDDFTVLITLKGAPDFVLSRCSTYKDDHEDKILPMTDEFRYSIQHRQEQLGKSGCRVIAMIQQKMSKLEYDKLIQAYGANKKQGIPNLTDLNGLPENNYCFIGMFSLLDPARPEVPDAVLKARRAHIRVVMITGDHPTTATTIAEKVNILSKEISFDHGIDTFKIECNQQSGEMVARFMRNNNELIENHIVNEVKTSIDINMKGVKSINNTQRKQNIFQRIWSRCLFYLQDPNEIKDVHKRPLISYGVVVTGSDLYSMDDYMWDWVLSHQEIVFARTSPEQKLRIVMEFAKRGEVIAVTGDGTNDAPALKQADLGVAMAAGADVAKEAGDMILLDNNFSSIINAIETGRLLSDNLKKVAIYLLPGGSWSEVIPVFFSTWLGIPLSLSLFLAVIFCMFNDVVNSLAMVSEKAEQDIMSRPPAIRRKTRLLNWQLLVHAYLIVGNIECFAAFFCFFWYYSSHGIPLNSIFFTYANYGTSPPINKTSNELTNIQETGQCIYFVALCIMQMFNLLSTRTRHVSLFQHNPFYGKARNLTILIGILFSGGIGVFVTQVSWFNTVFKTRPVPVKYVCPALCFGVGLFLFDELRKFLVRRYPRSFLAKMAW